jgi:acyl-CoA hydrolase
MNSPRILLSEFGIGRSPGEVTSMKGKTVQETSSTIVYQMLPEDANPVGNVHGGIIMKHVDTCAGVVAIRHARCNAVTASIDRMDFHHPVFVGDLLIVRASLNLVGKTSMEVGVRVEAENLFTGNVRHTASAYLTFVALDKNGSPAAVPPLILETKEETRRHDEAQERRKVRLAEKVRERAARSQK